MKFLECWDKTRQNSMCWKKIAFGYWPYLTRPWPQIKWDEKMSPSDFTPQMNDTHWLQLHLYNIFVWIKRWRRTSALLTIRKLFFPMHSGANCNLPRINAVSHTVSWITTEPGTLKSDSFSIFWRQKTFSSGPVNELWYIRSTTLMVHYCTLSLCCPSSRAKFVLNLR